MRKAMLYTMFFSLFFATGLASYTYEVYSYGEGKTLSGAQSILIDQQGGMYMLDLRDGSSANILGTSVLSQGSGGIWQIQLSYVSSVSMSGGQLHELVLGNDATATLSGGLIQQIRSGQNAWEWQYFPEPPTLVWNPHITIECLDHSYDSATKRLTGHWLDNTTFNIQLIDVQGYSPAIENIRFVPEPATLALIGLGGLLLRRKR